MTGKANNVTALVLYSLVTEKRHVVAVLKKSESCRCGCKGWCNLWAVWDYVAWCLKALWRGKHPRRQHDGSDWPVGSRGAAMANAPLCKAAVVVIKGDWMECAKSLGLPSWQSGSRPCYCCEATYDNMYDFNGLTLDEDHSVRRRKNKNKKKAERRMGEEQEEEEGDEV
eukprot:6263033-Pyramimonas_sp.AAC.1